MLRIVQNASAAGAKGYYSTSDYYTEGQELVGVWRGKGAARLGLSGEVKRQDWDRLCDNLDPQTGKTLTARQKEPRRVGYDFNFHVPKSLSVLYAMTQDERLLSAFGDSVDETMTDMEREMKTRVRRDGKNEDRTTGEMTFGRFIHFTSRPVGGIPDPHLHAHCFVFNTTYDDQEKRWKAGQFADLKRDAPYFEACFHVRLAEKLSKLGLDVQRKKHGWELAEVPASALTKFSRRTALIEAEAKEKGIVDPQEKAELGAKTRERKAGKLSPGALQTEWRSRMTDAERAAVDQTAKRMGGPTLAPAPHAVQEAARSAIDHCFERKSVVPERELLAASLKRAVGKASVAAVHQAVDALGLMHAQRQGRRWVTTPAVLAEEERMLDFARKGRGACRRLGGVPHVFARDWLNEGQKRAVEHVLNSNDRVILIRGAAGTGKTSMMQEAAEAIERAGTKVFAFAPSASAGRGVLRQEAGFAQADTVARLLVDTELQEKVRGNVLWIDEAGLLGVKTTAQLFDLAKNIDARVILSGDRRQHGPVERGAALRLLETDAGLVSAEITQIQRQTGDYRRAVEALSEGQVEQGFRQLDELGWIKEVQESERYALLAQDYVDTLKEGKTALVVSPTHREIEKITAEVRKKLKEAGRLGQDERSVPILRSANLTEAERADDANYLAGDVLVFHQNAKGHVKGDRVTAGDQPPPLDQAKRFQVFHPDTLPLAPGDVIRITRNGTSKEGHRLNNGALHTLRGFDAHGDLVLGNGWTVARDYGHLAHGVAVTSHASQGKTVDRVLIGQSEDSFPASSQAQFYVSVSRGRHGAVVYTSDKEKLLQAVGRDDERSSATELVAERMRHMRRLSMQTPSERRHEKRHDRSREMVYER